MTVAFDVFSDVAEGNGELSWTHTPSGTPRAAIVFIVEDFQSVDGVTGVTYGGTSMTEVPGSPNIHATGETGAVHCFFLGSSVPTGAQTVVVSISGVFQRRAAAITLTAVDDTEVVDSDGTIESTSLANPSVVLSLSGRISFAAIAFHSGWNDPSEIVPLASWTDRLEHDWGARVSGWYTYDTIASADVTAGWTQDAEDATMIALAVSEVSPEGRLIGMVYSMVTDRIG